MGAAGAADAPETGTRQVFGRVVARGPVDLGFVVGGTLALLIPEKGERPPPVDATLPAPFDGMMAQRQTLQHGRVQPGQPVLRRHDMSELRGHIAVPEQVIQRAGSEIAVVDPHLLRHVHRPR